MEMGGREGGRGIEVTSGRRGRRQLRALLGKKKKKKKKKKKEKKKPPGVVGLIAVIGLRLSVSCVSPPPSPLLFLMEMLLFSVFFISILLFVCYEMIIIRQMNARLAGAVWPISCSHVTSAALVSAPAACEDGSHHLQQQS